MGTLKDLYEAPINDYITDEDIKTFESWTNRETFNNLKAGAFNDMNNKILYRYIEGSNNDPYIILSDIENKIDSLSVEGHEAYKKEILEAFQGLKKEAEANPDLIELKNRSFEELEKIITKDLFVDYAEKEIRHLKEALELYYKKYGGELGGDPAERREIYNSISEYEFRKFKELYSSDTNKIKYNAIDYINYPLDKPNKELWRALEISPNGQLALACETGQKNNEDVVVFCSVSWDDPNTKITKHLTEWDKRVYIAISSLFAGGNKTFTIGQIYKTMGNDGSPSTAQARKINDSLTKMGTARLYISNKSEIEAGYNYPPFEYDENFLYFKRVSVIVNGIKTTGIFLKEEPPLMSFARGRNQITPINLELLKSPISKTEANLRIDDYLLEYIGHLRKNKKLSNKITFDTLCKACNALTSKQRERLPEKIEIYLSHYVKCKWIKGYDIDKNKDITIYIDRSNPQQEEKETK